MDKKSVRAVAVTIFSGVLFLESMFAGGVASEETGSGNVQTNPVPQFTDSRRLRISTKKKRSL